MIPLFLDVPLYNERATLDGQEYVLDLDYSEREDRWYLTISDVNEVALAAGIKLVSNWPLLRQRVDPRLPPGNLYAYDPLEGDPAGFSALGRSVILVYTPKGG